MGGGTEPSIGLGNLDRACFSSHHDETTAASKEFDLSKLTSDERRLRLQEAIAKMVAEQPGAQHIHAVTDLAATYFEVRSGTDREFTTFAIDEDGKFHSKSSTLRD